jgi:hypothetical protein
MHDVKDGKKEEMLLDNFSSNQPFFFFFILKQFLAIEQILDFLYLFARFTQSKYFYFYY